MFLTVVFSFPFPLSPYCFLCHWALTVSQLNYLALIYIREIVLHSASEYPSAEGTFEGCPFIWSFLRWSCFSYSGMILVTFKQFKFYSYFLPLVYYLDLTKELNEIPPCLLSFLVPSPTCSSNSLAWSSQCIRQSCRHLSITIHSLTCVLFIHLKIYWKDSMFVISPT